MDSFPGDSIAQFHHARRYASNRAFVRLTGGETMDINTQRKIKTSLYWRLYPGFQADNWHSIFSVLVKHCRAGRQ
jgi:hypothetical protein